MQHLLACTLWVNVKALYVYYTGAFRDLHVYMEFLQNYNLGVSGAPRGGFFVLWVVCALITMYMVK